jgi:hypothetical protein
MALTKINTKLIANNTIALTNIADNAVDATKIASNSILTRHIDDDQITADQIVDDIALAGNISTTGNFGVGGDITKGSGEFKIKNTANGENVGIYTTSSSSELHALKIHSGGNVEVLNGSLLVANNSDTQSIFGRTALGFVTGLSDYAYVGHLDVADSGGYALVQSSAGATFLNAEDGQDLSFAIHGTRKMVLDDSGKLGIGTTSPSELLHVSSTGSASILLEADSDNANEDHIGKIRVEQDGGATYSEFGIANSNVAYWNVSEFHRFSRQGTEKARIDTSGSFYIGTTNTGPAASEAGHYFDKDGYAVHRRSAAPSLYLTRWTSTGQIAVFHYAENVRGSISVDGSSTTYNTSSDERLKNVLGDAKGLEIINQLNPVYFEWKETGKKQDGLIAQEVEPLIPHAVIQSEENGYYQMDYGKLVTPLIKAVQEQQEQIEALEARITALE